MTIIRREKDKGMENKILEVAERLFLDKGFSLTSTTQIAKEVGCNQALIHYYFRTKESLFEKIFERKITIFANSLLQRDDYQGTFEERMRKRIRAHYNLIRENPKLPLLVINELITNTERMAALKKAVGDIPKEVVKKLDSELKEEYKKGNIREVETGDLLINVLSLNMSFFIIYPIVQMAMDMTKEQMIEFENKRMKVIEDTIMNSLLLK